MDNLTHTFTAISLSRVGLNRTTRFATLALVVGANLPDIDLAWSARGAASYLKYHRGITHSLLGITVLAAGLGVLLYLLALRTVPNKNSPQLSAPWLFGVCWIATASHLLLDFTNAYGVRPFLPVSGRWYAWGIMPIIDPLLLAVLAAGWAIPALFRLISEEVGAGKPGFRRGAIIALSGMVLLWGLRDLARRRVIRQLDSHNYGDEPPIRLDAFPSLVNPFQWTGVVETDSAFHLLNADAFADDVDPERSETLHKPSPSPALNAARKAPAEVIFCDFARFPYAEVSETEDGFEVRVRDLRFAQPYSEGHAFEVSTSLDKQLHVVSESFHF